LSEQDFLSVLQKEFGYRLGRLQKIDRRYQFPLRMTQAKKNRDGCVFLLGNSAHTMHPIAAQGFNLALYEVAVLAEEINGKTIDNMSLQKIHERIQPHQTASMQMSHCLAQIFSHPSFLMNCLLQLGMVGLDVVSPAKRKLMARMMGRSNSMPFLLSRTSD
jgi:2-octaprenyl-6-methoxyphenol hydroxylase